MLDNNFTKALKELLEVVNNFKGKTSMMDFIQDRLNASLQLYMDSLKEECDLIMELKPKTATKKLKTL